MKQQASLLDRILNFSALYGLMLAILVGLSTPVWATTYYWAGSQAYNGTLWSWPSNWIPSGVPGINDTAVIETRVAGDAPAFADLDTNAAVGGLIIGNTGFACTNGIGLDGLRDNGYSITLYGPMVIGECGEFDWIDGEIIGANTNASISGTLIWEGTGTLGGTLTITTNSTLAIKDFANHDLPNTVLNNYGTVSWPGGLGADSNGTAVRGGGTSGTFINNYGLWNCATDFVMNAAFGGNGVVFNNYGSFALTNGILGSQIQSGVTFNNSGTLDVRAASLTLQGGGSGSGLFLVEGGTTLAFSGGNYTAGPGALLTGPGTIQLNGATFTLGGTMSASNGVLSAGALAGSGGVVSSGSWAWTGGQLGSGAASTLTLAAPTVLTLAGQSGTDYDLLGTLTNAGTIALASGNVRLRGDYSAQLFNAADGLLNFEADSSLDEYGPLPTFYNYGTVRKSAGTGTSLIYPIFTNSGVLDAESGVISLLEGGAFLAGSSIVGPATARFSGGNFNMNVTLSPPTSVQQAGANVTGTSFIAGPGTWTWMSGILGSTPSDTLTLSTNLTLLLAGLSGSDYDLFGTLTNAGTILLSSGNLRLRGDESAQLFNLAGALLNFEADVSIDSYGPLPTIYNYGTVLKSAAAGTSTISPSFVDAGTLDARSGTLALNGGGSGRGLHLAEAGATLAFGGGYIYTAGPGAVLTGAGTNVIDGATFLLETTLTTSNGVLSAGALGGSNGVVSGSWTWTGGQIGSVAANTLTLGAPTVLNLAGQSGTDYDLLGTLTNAGTFVLTSGNLRLRGDQSAQLFNVAGALLNFEADSSLDEYGPLPTFSNYGTVRKSGGTGTSFIYPIFINSGVLDAESGVISFLDGGAFLAGSSIVGPATARFSGGNFNMNVTLSPPTSVQQAGANVTGTSFIGGPGTWTWMSGILGSSPSDTLTLSTNLTLLLAGLSGSDYDLFGTLTNAGTILLSSGNLRLRGDESAQLFNLAGALLNFEADVSIDSYGPLPTIYNYGTVRKTAASGTSSIGPMFNNSGALDVRSGTLALNGGGTASGSFLAEAGATLAFGGGYIYTAGPGSILSGPGTNVLNGGTFNLETTLSIANGVLAGSALAGSNGVVSGLWTWTSGSIGAGAASTLTLTTNTVLTLAGQNGSPYDILGILTDLGTLVMASGDLRLRGDYSAQLVNHPGALITVQTNDSIGAYSSPTTVFNFGTLRKAGGTGTTTISPYLSNAGTLDVQMGAISVVGGYSLANGDLNFGINSLSNYGQINLSGSATLAGTVSANLNNGYQPTVGNSFTVLTYGSETGLFTKAILPPAALWQTNYNATGFTLQVLLPAPTLIDAAWLGSGRFQFSFNTVTQANYTTLYSTNVLHGPWIPLFTNGGSGGLITVIDTGAGSSPSRFYRIEAAP